jgi:MFS family permease
MNDNATLTVSSSILPYAWVILLVVFLASIAAPLNQAKVPPLMPIIMDAFQLPLSQAGWLMSVFALTGMILALPAGIFLPRTGPKAMGIIALGCLALGSSLGALSTSATLLLLGRVIEGVGMGLIAVVAPAAIAMWFPPDKQGAPMGIWATWVPVGNLTMYALAPTLGIRLGWQVVWWIGAAFALLVLVLYSALMRLPPRLEKSPQQRPASAGLEKALANKMIWLLALEFCCFNLVSMSLSTFFPTFLVNLRGYPLGQAALIASISTMMVLLSAPLAGILSDRIGSRRLVFSFPFLIFAVMMVFPFIVSGWEIYAFMILLGSVVGAVPTATFAAAPEIMKNPELAGIGLAGVMVGQNLGMFIGPVLFGSLVEWLGWVTAGYILIPICILGFVAAWKVKVR